MITADRVEVWNWQCWRLLKDGDRVWVGFFKSEKDALSWVKTQTGNYVVNNVPPSGRLPSGRKDPTWSTPVSDGEIKEKHWQTTKRVRRASKAVTPKVVRPLTPEEIALKKDAAEIFEQHKADEAAELED